MDLCGEGGRVMRWIFFGYIVVAVRIVVIIGRRWVDGWWFAIGCESRELSSHSLEEDFVMGEGLRVLSFFWRRRAKWGSSWVPRLFVLTW